MTSQKTVFSDQHSSMSVSNVQQRQQQQQKSQQGGKSADLKSFSVGSCVSRDYTLTVRSLRATAGRRAAQCEERRQIEAGKKMLKDIEYAAGAGIRRCERGRVPSDSSSGVSDDTLSSGSDSGIETGEHWTPGGPAPFYHGLPVSYSTDQDPESSVESCDVKHKIREALELGVRKMNINNSPVNTTLSLSVSPAPSPSDTASSTQSSLSSSKGLSSLLTTSSSSSHPDRVSERVRLRQTDGRRQRAAQQKQQSLTTTTSSTTLHQYVEAASSSGGQFELRGTRTQLRTLEQGRLRSVKNLQLTSTCSNKSFHREDSLELDTGAESPNLDTPSLHSSRSPSPFHSVGDTSLDHSPYPHEACADPLVSPSASPPRPPPSPLRVKLLLRKVSPVLDEVILGWNQRKNVESMSSYKVLRLEGVDGSLDLLEEEETESMPGISSRPGVEEIRVDPEISFNKANLRQFRKKEKRKRRSDDRDRSRGGCLDPSACSHQVDQACSDQVDLDHQAALHHQDQESVSPTKVKKLRLILGNERMATVNY